MVNNVMLRNKIYEYLSLTVEKLRNGIPIVVKESHTAAFSGYPHAVVCRGP